MIHLSDAMRAQFYTELATLDAAGFPTHRAFETLSMFKEPKARAMAIAVSRALAHGESIARAGSRAGLFSPLEATLLEAGAASGKLEAIYRLLAQFYQDRAQHRGRIAAQLALPLGILALALCVAPLPAFVRGDLQLGQYLFASIGRLLIIVLLAYSGFVLMGKSNGQPGIVGIDRLLLRLPWLAALVRQRSATRFLETLGLMLDAGIPALSAVSQAAATVANVVARAEFLAVQQRLADGQSWHQALAQQRILDAHTQALLTAGEAAGRLAETVIRCAAQGRAAARQSDAVIATWLPRLIYIAVLAWMATTLLFG